MRLYHPWMTKARSNRGRRALPTTTLLRCSLTRYTETPLSGCPKNFPRNLDMTQTTFSLSMHDLIDCQRITPKPSAVEDVLGIGARLLGSPEYIVTRVTAGLIVIATSPNPKTILE